MAEAAGRFGIVDAAERLAALTEAAIGAALISKEIRL
jgi:hypothetical protein